VDVDIVRRELVSICDKPVFEYGPANSFYSHGVSIGNCYETEGRRYILFMGWQIPPGEHWHGQIGRLVLEKNFSVQIDSDEPFMNTDFTDPVSLSYPWVLRGRDGFYRMWYGSTVTWDTGNGEMLHVVNHAISADGHKWQRRGLSVPYKLGQAQAFSRPTVIGDASGEYHMWFSYRSGGGQKYRIGYASSQDCERWDLRIDQAGLDVSLSGWDSEMIEYPFVFDHKSERFLLYNGNGYGHTGFGLATLE
jgi:hypothetical protein